MNRPRFYVAHPDEVEVVYIGLEGLGDWNTKKRWHDPVRVYPVGTVPRDTGMGDGGYFIERADLYNDPIAAAIKSSELAKEIEES